MTTVQLFGDIGLYANYKQTVDFTSVSEQNTWFNSKTHTTINDVVYNKAYNSLKLNMQYGEAIKYSYIRLLNLDTSGRIYYYFIASVNVIDDATVEFILEPDVLQTYMTFWNLKESMVNRAHVDRWDSSHTEPIRITPNVEGIDALYEIESSQKYSNVTGDYYDDIIYFAYIVANFKDDTGNFRHVVYFLPFMRGVGSSASVKAGDETFTLPTLDELFSNELFDNTNSTIDPESIVCMGITPFMLYDIQGIEVSGTAYTYDLGTFPTGRIAQVATSDYLPFLELQTYQELVAENVMTVDFVKPTKPTNNATASDTFEPALYMAPYRYRNIISQNGAMNFEIPDIVFNEDNHISFIPKIGLSSQNILTVVGADLTGNLTTSLSKGEEISRLSSLGLTNASMIDTMDVMNNAWTTYMLTQRDSDRQILNNQAMSNIIQGLIFGSYGGALVTSRGTGGRDKRSLGKMAVRMAPGIALGGLASAGSAIIDSHYAWENQKLEERKIQNKAQTVNITGTDAANNTAMGLAVPYFTVMKCDDTNYQRAYDNFRKYGYMINEFTQLNIRSRKYYNYVMTNGAVIGGSIPEDVRMTIADIFDSGVTIFHGDYCNDLTYPTTENIERSLM